MGRQRAERYRPGGGFTGSFRERDGACRRRFVVVSRGFVSNDLAESAVPEGEPDSIHSRMGRVDRAKPERRASDVWTRKISFCLVNRMQRPHCSEKNIFNQGWMVFLPRDFQALYKVTQKFL